MKPTKNKQQIKVKQHDLTQKSAEISGKERMYKIIGAPWPPRKKGQYSDYGGV